MWLIHTVIYTVRPRSQDFTSRPSSCVGWCCVLSVLFRSTDKINGFHSKVQLWQQHVERGNLEMFTLNKQWQDVNTAALCEIIVKHLKTLEEKMSFYFSSASIECLDWVRDPYSSASVFTGTGGTKWTETKPWFKAKLCWSAFGQFLVVYCQGVPHSGKQSYFDIVPIFHDISVWGELFKSDCYKH